MALTVALGLACSPFPEGAGEVLLAPDVDREGADGADGPRGAARVSFTAQARVTERLPVQVVFPALRSGELDATGAPYPVVVFLQGAGVARERYHWLARHLATRGYVVLIPVHLFDQAILDPDNAVLALRALRLAVERAGTLRGATASSAPAAVVGHSTGGLIAARQWVAHGDFAALAMLGASPPARDEVASRRDGAVLSIAGTSDVPAPPNGVLEGLRRFTAPRLFALVDGLNHYAWTDNPEDDERASDGPRPSDLGLVRGRALLALDLWLDATLRRDAAAGDRLRAAALTSGVSLQR